MTVLKRISLLIDDILRGDPFSGIGKPEPLRHRLTGAWSRRSTDEHRLAYLVRGDDLVIWPRVTTMTGSEVATAAT